MAKVKYLGREQNFRYMGHITGRDYMLHNYVYKEVDDRDAKDMEGGNFEVDYGTIKKATEKVKKAVKKAKSKKKGDE